MIRLCTLYNQNFFGMIGIDPKILVTMARTMAFKFGFDYSFVLVLSFGYRRRLSQYTGYHGSFLSNADSASLPVLDGV